MSSTGRHRSIWKRRFTRRQILSAGAKAGVGALALAAIGAGTPRPSPVQGQDDGTVRRGGSVVFPFVGPYSGNPPTLDPYENLTYRTQISSGYHYSRLIRPVSAGPGVSPTNQADYEADLASLPETPTRQHTYSVSIHLHVGMMSIRLTAVVLRHPTLNNRMSAFSGRLPMLLAGINT